MVNRKGVFIGAYVPLELKESLKRRAAAEHRTLSQEITRILVEAVHGKGLPAGSVDRRTTPRHRAAAPPIRCRAAAPMICRLLRAMRKSKLLNNFYLKFEI